MKQQEVIQILKTRFGKIQASFDTAIAYLDAEDIHAFRVEVKKLQAFLHLAPNGLKVKLPRRLRQFYHRAGLIRNLQLQQQRIRDAFLHKGGLPETYLTLLAIETAAAVRRARKFAAGKLSMPAIERELLCTFPGGLTKDALLGFTRYTADQLKNFGNLGNKSQPIDDDSLHNLRKCLKDLLYDHPFIELETSEILPFSLLAGKDTLSALTGLLGRFQDLQSGLLLLQPLYVDQVTDAGERKMLERIRAKWEKDKAAIKDEVFTTLLPVLHCPLPAICVSDW